MGDISFFAKINRGVPQPRQTVRIHLNAKLRGAELRTTVRINNSIEREAWQYPHRSILYLWKPLSVPAKMRTQLWLKVGNTIES